MKSTRFSLLFLVALVFLLSISVFAQKETFSDANVEYTFDLPESNWKMTVKPSATISNVEYVNGDRANGHFEVRKITVKSGELLSDTIRDEEQRLQFLSGYVAGKEEDFKGSLSGKVFNYEFIRSAHNMSGRFYFLKVDDTTVYVLRFDGLRDKLRSARNETDSIARTFSLRKK